MYTKLYDAIIYNRIGEIHQLLQDPTTDINQESAIRGTPFDYALKYNRTEVALLLLKKGANDTGANIIHHVGRLLTNPRTDISPKHAFKMSTINLGRYGNSIVEQHSLLLLENMTNLDSFICNIIQETRKIWGGDLTVKRKPDDYGIKPDSTIVQYCAATELFGILKRQDISESFRRILHKHILKHDSIVLQFLECMLAKENETHKDSNTNLKFTYPEIVKLLATQKGETALNIVLSALLDNTTRDQAEEKELLDQVRYFGNCLHEKGIDVTSIFTEAMKKAAISNQLELGESIGGIISNITFPAELDNSQGAIEYDTSNLKAVMDALALQAGEATEGSSKRNKYEDELPLSSIVTKCSVDQASASLHDIA